ncbi:MAG: hypothetical protein LH473_14190, partial [Chitinophagales bacterium]|nr:hypothetical protein [Chitinophagales bacterium]
MALLKVNYNGDSISSVLVAPVGGTNAYAEGNSLDADESGTLFFSGFEHGTNPFGYPYAGALYARYDSSLHLISYWVPVIWICGSSNVSSYP